MLLENEKIYHVIALDHYTTNGYNSQIFKNRFSTIEYFGRFHEETEHYLILEVARDEFWKKDELDESKSYFASILKEAILEKHQLNEVT